MCVVGTDVTGFGILGHASNLASNQAADVDLVLHTFPVIAGMAQVDAHLRGMFKLALGYSAETSGGLLVVLPNKASAEEYCKDIFSEDKCEAWIVGEVVEGTKKARVSENVRMLAV